MGIDPAHILEVGVDGALQVGIVDRIHQLHHPPMSIERIRDSQHCVDLDLHPGGVEIERREAGVSRSGGRLDVLRRAAEEADGSH